MVYVGNGNTIALQQSGATYVTSQWVNANITKTGTNLIAVFKKIDDGYVISTKSATWNNILTVCDVKNITLFGFYLDNNSANRQRYTIGATKNFYLKKL